MRLNKDSEETLQALYSLDEEQAQPVTVDTLLTRAGTGEEALKAVLSAGLVVDRGAGLELTAQGRLEAATVVRRHRLAERLLCDILRLSDATTESAACEFEHTLEEEATDSICTLLGHPRVCPHGKTIPPGSCCGRRLRSVGRLVEPLSELPTGASGRLAYIQAARDERLHRLAAFGLVPGTEVHVHQTWPSLVIAVGETHLALDRETARDIFVRRSAGQVEPPEEGGHPDAEGGPDRPAVPRRRRWGWRR